MIRRKDRHTGSEREIKTFKGCLRCVRASVGLHERQRLGRRYKTFMWRGEKTRGGGGGGGGKSRKLVIRRISHDYYEQDSQFGKIAGHGKVKDSHILTANLDKWENIN